MPDSLKIPPQVVVHEVWTRYQEEKPVGVDFSYWVERVAKELQITEKKVREVVAAQTAMFNALLRRDLQTTAQEVAEHLGAGVEKAIAILGEGLQATSKKPLLDKSGRPVVHDGVPVSWEAPDWASRLTAAKLLIEVHGAKAPQQVNVQGQVAHLHLHKLSQPELMEKWNGISSEIKRLTAAVDGSRDVPERIDDPGSRAEPVPVVDGVHEDQGRAGCGEPVQAVPAKAIHSTDSEGSGS